jgi:hypothetical protein
MATPPTNPSIHRIGHGLTTGTDQLNQNKPKAAATGLRTTKALPDEKMPAGRTSKSSSTAGKHAGLQSLQKLATGLKAESTTGHPALHGADEADADDSPMDVKASRARMVESLDALLPAHGITNASPVSGPQQLQDLEREYGATEEDFRAFQKQFHVHFAPSASSGANLSDLNDHHGVIKVVGRGANGMHFVERLPVLKVDVPSKEPGGAPEARYFVKGYGNRLIKFSDLRNEPSLRLREKPKSDLESAAGIDPTPGRGTMETALRSGIARLSERSELFARRNGQESDHPVTTRPLNPSAIKSDATWWSNAETALLPGAGPLQANGIRALQMDFYKLERRLMIFANEYEYGKDGKPIPASQRPRPLRAQTEGDQPHPPSSVIVGGPVLSEIRGVSGWEVVGPASQTSVKAAKGERMFDELAKAIGKARNSSQPTTVKVTTDNGSVHELVISDQGIKMSLVNPKPSLGAGSSAPIMTAEGNVQAEVDVYSFNGGYTGVDNTESGLAEPTFIASTGEQLPAGPLIQDATGVLGNMRSAMKSALRLLVGQPALGRADAGTVDWMVNTAARVAAKVGVVYGFNLLGKMAAERIGVAGLSSLGGGNLGFSELAKAVACMVVTQEVATWTSGQIRKVMPSHVKDPENLLGDLSVNAALPAGEEMVRLMINMGMQASFGIARGGAADFISLAVASVTKGGVEWMKSRMGSKENHAAAYAGLTLVYNLIYNVSRGMGNAYNLPGQKGTPTPKEFGASLAARLIGRADGVIEPVAQPLLNSLGVAGDNASAFDDQVSRETRLSNAISCIDALLNDGSVGLQRGTNRASEWEPVANVLNSLRAGLEHAQQMLNRAGLGSDPAPLQDLAMELREVEAAANSTTSPLAPRKPDEIAQEDKVHQMLEALIRDSEAVEQGKPTPSGKPATRYSVAELRPAEQQKFNEGTAGARARWNDGPAGVVKEAGRHHEVNLDYGQTPRPATAKPNLFRDTQTVDPDVTTWTRPGQRTAVGTTRRMARQAGIHSKSRRKDLPAISAGLHKRSKRSAVAYTKQSGNFHLPIRFDYTGRLKYTDIAPGSRIRVPHMVMTAVGARPDDEDSTVDPRAILEVNLLARHADKFPSVADRTVATLAPYLRAGETTRDGKTIAPGKAPQKHVTENELVSLTEMFSATMSPAMGAYFGAGISAGVTRENSQRIKLSQLTGINFANISELAQAELVLTPGAVFRVRRIDPNAGKTAAQAGEQDLGQVLFFEQVDTYALERRFHEHVDNKAALKENEELIEPRSGHFLTATSTPDKDAWIFDTGSNSFRRYDSVKDAGKQVLAWDNAKSYFLGRGLEDPGKFTAEGPPERARWMYPYDSDQSFRAIKEAIHACILSGDELATEGHLDVATSNIHHEYFRKKGGYADTQAGKDRAAREEAVREQAGDIADYIDGLDLDSPMTQDQAVFVSWMLTSLLRKRIEFVPLDGKGGTPDPIHLNETYDKIDLKKEAAAAGALTDHPAEQEHVICMGPDGFYNQRTRNGQREVVKLTGGGAGDGLTLGNLLHAFCREAYPGEGKYRAQPGDSGTLRADGAARENAQDILDLMKRASKAQYLPLQQAMIAEAHERGLATAMGLPPEALAPKGRRLPPPEGSELGGMSLGKDRGSLSAQTRDAYIKAFSSNYEVAASWLTDLGMKPVRNGGGGANNCLIITMLQHATGDYSQDHDGAAGKVRSALMAKFPHIKWGEPLHSDSPEARWLLKHVNDTYGGGVQHALVFIEGTVPGADGSVQPVLRQLGNTDAEGVVLHAALNYGGHFEALHDTHEQPLVPDFWNVITTHQLAS